MTHFPKTSLFLGGARSGKSQLAENLVTQSHKSPVYIASAEIRDAEMRERIDTHQARRGENWQLIEAPLDVAGALAKNSADQIVLFDCATLWLSNHLLAENNIENKQAELLAAIENCAGQIVCVSNEVGMGLVPDNALGRRFRDAQGALNQALGAQADLVVFAAAGLPLVLKGQMPMDQENG